MSKTQIEIINTWVRSFFLENSNEKQHVMQVMLNLIIFFLLVEAIFVGNALLAYIDQGHIQNFLQVLAIEFVLLAIDFIPLANEFILLAIEFIPFAIEFVTLAFEFVALA